MLGPIWSQGHRGTWKLEVEKNLHCFFINYPDFFLPPSSQYSVLTVQALPLKTSCQIKPSAFLILIQPILPLRGRKGDCLWPPEASM